MVAGSPPRFGGVNRYRTRPISMPSPEAQTEIAHFFFTITAGTGFDSTACHPPQHGPARIHSDAGPAPPNTPHAA